MQVNWQDPEIGGNVGELDVFNGGSGALYVPAYGATTPWITYVPGDNAARVGRASPNNRSPLVGRPGTRFAGIVWQNGDWTDNGAGSPATRNVNGKWVLTTAAIVPFNGGGGITPAGGGGGGGDFGGGGGFGGGFNIGAFLAQQQVASAISTLFSANQSLMVAQTTAPTKGPFAMAILQGMSLGLGQSTGASGASAGTSQTALLMTLLGANTFTSLVSALNTYNAILGLAGATFTTIANGHNSFLSSLSSILTTISNNTLIGTLGSGGGEGTGALLSIMLQTTANTAFVSANPQVTVPFTTSTMDSAFSTLETSFTAWLNSATTNAMLAGLLKS